MQNFEKYCSREVNVDTKPHLGLLTHSLHKEKLLIQSKVSDRPFGCSGHDFLQVPEGEALLLLTSSY